MRGALRLIGVIAIISSLMAFTFSMAESAQYIINGDLGGSFSDSAYTRLISTQGEAINIHIQPMVGGNFSIFFDGTEIGNDQSISTGSMGVHNLTIISDGFVSFKLYVKNDGMGQFVPVGCGLFLLAGVVLVVAGRSSRGSHKE